MTDDDLVKSAKALREGLFDGDVTALLRDIGYAGLFDEEDLVASYLTSTDPFHREVAISNLGLHWRLKTYAQRAEEMALADPDDRVRLAALYALGGIFHGTRNAGATRFLLSVIRSSSSWDLRDAAYYGLLRVLGHDVRHLFRDHAVDEADFDQHFLAEADNLVQQRSDAQ